MPPRKALDEYVCKECNHLFTVPYEARNDLNSSVSRNGCPNCGQAGVFNITLEKENAKTNPHHPWF